VSVVPETRRAH